MMTSDVRARDDLDSYAGITRIRFRRSAARRRPLSPTWIGLPFNVHDTAPMADEARQDLRNYDKSFNVYDWPR